MVKIFISYRRADSSEVSTRLYDRLVYAFGRENIFKDVDSLQRGDEFPTVLREWVNTSDVVLTVMGERWLTVQDEEGRRRLDDPKDWVRQETQMALERGKEVALIPTLVDGAVIPQANYLPDELKPLLDRDAHTLRPEKFHEDVTALIMSIRRRFKLLTAPPIDLEKMQRDLVEVVHAQSWDAARDIVAAMRAAGSVPPQFRLDAIEKQIYTKVQEDQRNRDYDSLCRLSDLVDSGFLPAEEVLSALEAFWQIYPVPANYDPSHLLRRYTKRDTDDILRSPADVQSPVVIQPKNGHHTPATSIEWVEVAAGPVTLITEKDWARNYIPKGKSQVFEVPLFHIAKYPITNAQYALFIEAGGYTQDKWWTEDGWKQREAEQWTEPRFWQEDPWNRPDHPVVGVSWYEAIAYSQWLSEITGENILLPTEQQWQRAAQGDKGNVYPWGNIWDGKRCNNSVPPQLSQLTTPVKLFEGQGSSPFGVCDMSGNVWEWCLTEYETGKNRLTGINIRAMRGGSWRVNHQNNVRANCRNWYFPRLRINGGGFRVARG